MENTSDFPKEGHFLGILSALTEAEFTQVELPGSFTKIFYLSSKWESTSFKTGKVCLCNPRIHPARVHERAHTQRLTEHSILC